MSAHAFWPAHTLTLSLVLTLATALAGSAPSFGGTAEAADAPVELTRKHWIVHKVRPGESLRTIAQEYYGDAAWWLHIYHTNIELLKSPRNSVQPGMKLKIELKGPLPQAARANATEAPNYVQVKVRVGDTLESIAQSHMGSARFWPRLMELNRRQLGSKQDLEPGMVLRVQELAGSASPTPRAEKKLHDTYSAVDASDEESPMDSIGEAGLAAAKPVAIETGRSPASLAAPSPPALSHFDDFIDP